MQKVTKKSRLYLILPVIEIIAGISTSSFRQAHFGKLNAAQCIAMTAMGVVAGKLQWFPVLCVM